MRKREIRTDVWCGLGNWLSLEIDGRAHDVRTSGNRQKHEDEKISRYYCTAQQLKEGRVGMGGKVSETDR
jgi:hypothetical protein